jgi:hypothetical protein
MSTEGKVKDIQSWLEVGNNKSHASHKKLLFHLDLHSQL